MNPAPVHTPLDGGAVPMPPIWQQWFSALVLALNRAAQSLSTVALSAQAATIATTTLVTPSVKAGFYRLSTYLRITQAATVSSSATVTIGWTDGVVACTTTLAAVTGNTTATTQTTEQMVHADAASPFVYAVLYVSNGATPMQFAFALRVEALP